MNSIFFFAAKNDMVSVLGRVEKRIDIRYSRIGAFENDVVEICRCFSDIGNVGIANSETGETCESFLIYEHSYIPKLRTVALRDGRVKYLLDQLNNECTVVLIPAGMWSSSVVLRGKLGSAFDNEFSSKFSKIFMSEIKLSFVRSKYAYVGPSALAAMRSGVRLTLSVQASRDFDLEME